MNIFEYAERYVGLMRQIEELDGEITPEIDELLKATEEDVEAKIHAYAGLIKSNEAKAEMLKDEATRLSQKAKSLTNLNERLKNYTKYAIQMFGYEDKKTGTQKLVYDDLTVYIRKVDVIDFEDEAQNAYEQSVQDAVLYDTLADVSDDYVGISLNGLRFSDAHAIAKQFPEAINPAKVHAKVNRIELLKLIKPLDKDDYPTDVPKAVGVKKSESVIFK